MLKRKLKKAFTLVELLVVIAILAILATVSVVGYTQFTKRAHLSNDQSTIGMINDNLRAASVGNEPESVSDALSLLYQVGFTSDKLEPYSAGYHYVYDSSDNMFYLVDDNDKIVFPEEKAIGTSIWALYRNRDTDKINGVTNYVALEPVTDAGKFGTVFGGGTAYVLNLNSYYIGIKKPENANVTLTNGSVAADSGFTVSEDDDSVKQQTIAEVGQAGGYADETGVISEYLFDFPTDQGSLLSGIGASAEEKEGLSTITIRDCVFVNSSEASFEWADVDVVIIENCTFVGSTKWALAIGHNNTQYIVRNNVFYNCERGINFQKCASSNGATIIENNTFILNNTSKSKAFQFANYTNEVLEKANDVCVIIRNNTVQSAVGVVNIHETMVQSINGNIRTGVVNLVDLQTTGTAMGKNGQEETFTFVSGSVAGNYQKLVRFENNTTSSVSAKVTPDLPDCAFDGICKEYMDTMVNYYNSIFQ